MISAFCSHYTTFLSSSCRGLIYGSSRTRSGPLESAANRKESKQEGVWKRVQKTSGQRFSTRLSSRDGISAAHKPSLLYRQQQKTQIIRFHTDLDTEAFLLGLGGFANPPGLIRNWLLTAVSAHMFTGAKRDRWLTAVLLISSHVWW